MKQGICVAGNAIVDTLYPIERYPKMGNLTTILPGITKSTGGAMCNTVIDLARLDSSLPLQAICMLGEDEEADFVTGQLDMHPNISQAGIVRGGKTSFTAVMCDEETKQRTFFQYRGANSLLDETHFDWNAIGAKIFHIGYILLLDKLDEPDDTYGTKMARLLHRAQQNGCKTSIDVVSEEGGRFKNTVCPALRYTDYCIINELEAQQATGIRLRGEDGKLLFSNARKVLQALFDAGVSTWAVIHCPEAGFGMNAQGEYVEVKSLQLPSGHIVGTVGAGDAFCAGVLYAAYYDKPLEEAIADGHIVAACSLTHETASGGIFAYKDVCAQYKSLAQR